MEKNSTTKKKTMRYGTTVSSIHLEHLGLDLQESMKQIIALGFDYLRIGSYWSTLEPREGEWQWQPLDTILDLCEQANQAVILTIGCKAPRWPEFFLPQTLSADFSNPILKKRIFTLLQSLVSRYKNYNSIHYWQVENEPLDPVWPSQAFIPRDVLEQEVQLVKGLDSRPILLTLWGNELKKRQNMGKMAPLADVIGVDIYYRQYIESRPWRQHKYIGPTEHAEALSQLIQEIDKPVWVTELQAEPWEKDEVGYLAVKTPSISPQRMTQFWRQAVSLPVEAIFFWGAEYWLWKAKQGDFNYLEVAKTILSS